MKLIGLIILTVTLSSVAFAQKATVSSAKKIDNVKNWYIGLGPTVNTLGGALGGSSGSKFVVNVGWNTGLSEHWNFTAGVSMNSNTQSPGNAINYASVGFNGYTKDRGSDVSPLFRVGGGFGGTNRNSDGGFILDVAAGAEFFRTKEFSLQVALGRTILATSAVTGLSAYPAVDSLTFTAFF